MGLPLVSDLIPGTESTRHRVLFLHGILGRGSNLRSLATRFVQARPNWQAMTVDLRGHGHSPKGQPDASLDSVVDDLLELGTFDAVVGHSFGGKVALAMAPSKQVQQILTLDSNPGLPPVLNEATSPTTILGLLRAAPPDFPTRNAFVQHLVGQGTPQPIAQWLAMNLESTPPVFRMGLDLDEIAGLYASYQTTDLWPTVENPPFGVQLHFVIADQSRIYSTADRSRAADLPHVTLDTLNTGHWMHAENLEGVLGILLNRIA
ncbi:MAG: alpha/beta fold hydrolase [Fimbriiglobus sp.]